MPRPASRSVMFDVVPWPTPTRATTEATPMMTPSIVRAARSRLVRSRDSASRSSSREAHADDLPVAQVDLPVGGRGDLGVVGDEDDRPAGGVELVEEAHDVRAGVAVEVAGRLVGQDERRLRDERPGDRDPLLLAAGQLGRLVVEPVAQPEPLERGLRPGGPLAARDALVQQRRRDVVERRRPRQQVVRLEDEPDRPAAEPRPARRRRARRPACRRAGSARPSGGRGSPGCSSSCVLPEPDGPTIATNSPGMTSRLTSSRAGTSIRPMS